MAGVKRHANLSAEKDELDLSKKPRQELPSQKSTEEQAIATCESVVLGTTDLGYIQVIVTGPACCGKTCLVLSYMEKLFPPSQSSFLSKQYLRMVPDEKPAMIWDLDASYEFTEYRKKSYAEADVALLCFDIGEPKSSVAGRSRKNDLVNHLSQWYNELENCKNIPVILVGLKSDLKDNSKGSFFSKDDMETTKTEMQRIRLWREISAFADREAVDKLFTDAIRLVREPKSKRMFADCGVEFLWPK